MSTSQAGDKVYVERASATIPDIELAHITMAYGHVVAVDDISLTIGRGEFFSLLGPSGCGKTTVLRIIAGFTTPSAGVVRIRGHVANDIPPYRRETNMVFQQLALFPHLTVFENVAFGPRIRRVPGQELRQRVSRALETVGLGGYDARRPHQLSGGQQQRVAIARALVNEPAALLLDEPLGSLDLKLRQQMQLELKAMQKSLGTTFVYVTHDQGEAMTMSDRIAVMRDGRIEQIGRPKEIYRQPRTRFVAHFIGETNLFEGTVVSATGDMAIVECSGLRVTASAGAQPGRTVALSVRPEDVRLQGLISGEARALDSPTLNAFPASVQSVFFLGAHIRYELAMKTGRKLVAHVPADATAPYGQGDLVEASWAARSAVVLEEL